MSEPLTREQRIRCIVETLRPTDPDSWEPNILYVTAECDGMDFTLRQQLAAMTEERDEQCAGKMAWFEGMNDMREQRTALERQLTKVTSDGQYHMDCINLLATHIGRLGETSDTVVDAAIQQLAAMTAERDEAVRIATGLIAWAPITDADVKWAEAKLAAQKHQGGLP